MASSASCTASRPLLTSVPDEIVLHILSFLDIPDLLKASRTSRHLRLLCLDPVLHTARLIRASLTIERSIPVRPPLVELMQHRIYITRTSLAARDLGRNLIKIKLNRSLLQRPSAEQLVEQGVLPGECLHSRIAPSLISTRRRIEKERVKDVLRHWIEEWGRKGSSFTCEAEPKPDVRFLARRFTRDKEVRDNPRWGRGAAEKDQKEMPTRAKVLGLRRFWEKIGRNEVSV
ncbi:MAG: hypothetical protein M1818_001418 [Claussenomyces sp. TS43310]|nr:MAG: hypothetical protein M1818_001418 [Claussenomyces sp. TS43310]